MVSTRQMTVTSGSGVDDGSFDAAGNPIVSGGSGSGGQQSNEANAVVTAANVAANVGSAGELLAPTRTLTVTAPTNPVTTPYVVRRKASVNLQLLDMPMEILDKIFTYVGYKKVAQIRVVSKSMNAVCGSVLNSTFQKLQTKLSNRFKLIKNSMPRRESSRRVHPLSLECDIVETCYMRLSLLQMTFGKHIDRKHICFFAGAILDEVLLTLRKVHTSPSLRHVVMTEELYDLSTMAMEYFKEHLEPQLPTLVSFYDFSESTTESKYLMDTPTTSKINASTGSAYSSHSSSPCPSPPQTNMVLRKGIRKIKQGMKRYNNQLTVLRNDLRYCKRKSIEQAKQLGEMQKLLAETKKQTLEYAARLNENDKKNEEMSMKISTLLQESNKCKTELQYWRTLNGPSRPTGEDEVDFFEADPAGLDGKPAVATDHSGTEASTLKPFESSTIDHIGFNTKAKSLSRTTFVASGLAGGFGLGGDTLEMTSVICSVGQPATAGVKRKAPAELSNALSDGLISTDGGDGDTSIGGRTMGPTGGAPSIGSDIKKARRVQNKARCLNINSSSSSISSIAGGGKVTRSK